MFLCNSEMHTPQNLYDFFKAADGIMPFVGLSFRVKTHYQE